MEEERGQEGSVASRSRRGAGEGLQYIAWWSRHSQQREQQQHSRVTTLWPMQCENVPSPRPPSAGCRQQHGARLGGGHCYCNISAVTWVAHDPARPPQILTFFRVGGGDPPATRPGRHYACVACHGASWRAPAAPGPGLGTDLVACYITGNSFLLGIILFSLGQEASTHVGYFLWRDAAPANQSAARRVYQLPQPIIRSGKRGGRQ